MRLTYGGNDGLGWKANVVVTGYEPEATGEDLVGIEVLMPFDMGGYESLFSGTVVEYDGASPEVALASGDHWDVHFVDGDVRTVSFEELEKYAGDSASEHRITVWKERVRRKTLMPLQKLQLGMVELTEQSTGRGKEYDARRAAMLKEALMDTAFGTRIGTSCITLYCALLNEYAQAGVYVAPPDAVMLYVSGTDREFLNTVVRRHELIASPVHISDDTDGESEHWVAFLINTQSRRITVLNSSRQKTNSRLDSVIATVKDAIGYDSVSVHARMPTQENAVDCGVFVVEAIRRIVEKGPLDFTQVDMPKIRERIAVELFCDRLFDDSAAQLDANAGRGVRIL